MNKTSLKFTALFTAGLLWSGLAHAQESINTSGGDATGSGGSAAYSIGQVVYTTSTGSSGSVAQGVQQAYEIFSLDIKEVRSSISLEVFPNPTTNNLTLQISEHDNEKLSYQVYDMRGRILNNGQVRAQQTQINMNGLPAATYFLHIVDQENKKVQSFKIIKSQ